MSLNTSSKKYLTPLGRHFLRLLDPQACPISKTYQMFEEIKRGIILRFDLILTSNHVRI